MKAIYWVAVILGAFAVLQAVEACPNQPPSLPPGSKWVPQANCTRGTTYNEGTSYHCHCWCHKGYICDRIAAPPATTTVAPTTVGTCARPPPVPTGSKWVAAANCPKGPTYNEGTAYHCHCWCHKGYICDPKPAPATTEAPITTTSKEPCASKQPPVPTGSTWVANANCPVGPTYNNPGNGGQPYHCHCWCHKGYICDPKATTTAATTAGTTDGTTAGTTEVTTEGTTEVTTEGTTEVTTEGTTEVTTAGTTEVTTAGTTESTTAGVTTAGVTIPAITTPAITTLDITTIAVTTPALTTVAVTVPVGR